LISDDKLKSVESKDFKRCKYRISSIIHLLQNSGIEGDDRKKLVEHVLAGHYGGISDILQSLRARDGHDKPKGWLSWVPWLGSNLDASQFQKDMRTHAAAIADCDFLSSLPDLVTQEPLLQHVVSDAKQAAHLHFA
jgi:hypothetical protein